MEVRIAARAEASKVRGTMPSARVRAAAMTRAQSDIANAICKRDFRHEDGSGQWSSQKKEALVKEINGEFVKRKLKPIYNIDKLDMWTGNSLYRYRVKQRNAPPKSWKKKSSAGRQALALSGKANNQSQEPRTPIGCQPEPLQLEQTAAPATCTLEPSDRGDGGAQTPVSCVEELAASAQIPEAGVATREAGVETPEPPSMLPSNKPDWSARVQLVRLSTAASGDDWWLPYRPGRAYAVTPELDAVASEAGPIRAPGNRDPAHVPASPGPACRVTRSLKTLLTMRA